MTYYKQIEKSIRINGKPRRLLDLKAEVFSYDEEVSKFIFTLETDEEIDLTKAKVTVVLNYLASDGSKGVIFDEKNGGVESIKENKVYYIVSEKLRGYEGNVTMGLNVDLLSGEKIDIQNMKFKMTKSLIDSSTETTGEIYFEDMETILARLTKKADDSKTELNELVSKVSLSADKAAGDIQAELEKMKQEGIKLQPDWKQADKTKIDYIQNKPFNSLGNGLEVDDGVLKASANALIGTWAADQPSGSLGTYRVFGGDYTDAAIYSAQLTVSKGGSVDPISRTYDSAFNFTSFVYSRDGLSYLYPDVEAFLLVDEVKPQMLYAEAITQNYTIGTGLGFDTDGKLEVNGLPKFLMGYWDNFARFGEYALTGGNFTQEARYKVGLMIIPSGKVVEPTKREYIAGTDTTKFEFRYENNLHGPYTSDNVAGILVVKDVYLDGRGKLVYEDVINDNYRIGEGLSFDGTGKLQSVIHNRFTNIYELAKNMSATDSTKLIGALYEENAKMAKIDETTTNLTISQAGTYLIEGRVSLKVPEKTGQVFINLKLMSNSADIGSVISETLTGGNTDRQLVSTGKIYATFKAGDKVNFIQNVVSDSGSVTVGQSQISITRLADPVK